MRFLKLTIAYEGTAYVGWQVQANGVSIQGVLESAWLAVTGETKRITASGRTDAGVHALGQVCSLATASPLPPQRLERALNSHLPDDIRVLLVEEASTNFHAIRDARSKTYRYCLQHGRRRDLFQRRFCWHVPVQLDTGAMREGAGHLTGTHDFTSFQTTGAERLDAIRTIYSLEISEHDERPFRYVTIRISANGFLYNMVRNITGSLVMVGRGRRAPGWMEELLAARDRTLAGPTAPAHGLFLESVEYGETEE